jgi:hypothetical protein
VIVVTPVLNIAVPTLLIPVVGEDAMVAPVIAHVKEATVQLSLLVGFGVTTDAVHKPASVLAEIFAGQLIVGAMLSVTITVNEQVAVRPALSVTM